VSILDFSFLDFLDILLVAFLLYQLYRLIKDTVAINVLMGVAAIYVVWKIVQALNMELLGEILGQFIGVGVIAVVIVFQQEIRKFLLVLGSTNFTNRRKFLKQLKWLRDEESKLEVGEVLKAVKNMSAQNTGALIVFERESKLGLQRDTGTELNAEVSENLLASIFNKYSPLHDGAVIISANKVVAAGCILPISDKSGIPSRFGMRHRAAIGIAEKTNAFALIVSEETGNISIADNDDFINKVPFSALKDELRQRLNF
jgi:uncharacterized protein (TIGR00159 family)